MSHSITEMTGDISGGVSLGASTTIAEYMLPLLIGESLVARVEGGLDVLVRAGEVLLYPRERRRAPVEHLRRLDRSHRRLRASAPGAA